MIPGITEINFPSYATLHQASVSFVDMGERTISTQVRIDGDIVPDFSGWQLEFKGERFILPVADPQATKDNSSRNSIIDLTFQSWPIYQLKRYFFVSLATIEAGVEVPDRYNASVLLNARGFVNLFQRVLSYYYGDDIRIELNPNASIAEEPAAVEINHTLIWDVLTKVYEIYSLRWVIVYDAVSSAYVIKVGYPADEIGDHDFAYGFSGGLLRFERQVQDEDIHNILLGRGGEKNLPYRYFKKVDPNNPDWAADPDAIPELANIYFDRLRDINFRWYVRGWVKNVNRDPSHDSGYDLPDYDDNDVPADYLWAYRKGRYTDTKFNPVEYVKDDASIAKYGERWGSLDDNDDVFPTIQGAQGDVDEVVAVSEIVADDMEEAAEAAVRERTIESVTVSHEFPIGARFEEYINSERFTIPAEQTGNVYVTPLTPFRIEIPARGKPTRVEATDIILETSTTAVNVNTGDEYPIAGLTAGTYYLHIHLVAYRTSTTGRAQTYTYGLNSSTVVYSGDDANAWKPTFDIWVKNIWGSTQGSTETDTAYANRVWAPILGDRLGNEAKVVFSTGFMSASEDYEFPIAAYPVKDRSKSINGTPSEWRITLYKSDAEFDTTGLYVPNSTTGGKPAAGDRFFFIGIDMPHAYVEWAEERLNQTKVEALDDYADINPTWVIGLDKIRVHTLADNEYGDVLADRLKAGAILRITDPRFTGGNILLLYAQSITFTWQEPSDSNPYTVPDIEVVLSDKVISTESPIGRLSRDISTIRSTYIKASDIDSTVRRIASPLFLKKTGESEVSASPTAFSSRVSSQNFRMGDFGGAGWGFYEDGEGQSVLELDRLIVRTDLSVNTLVANQIAYVGGKQILSAAAIDCVQVDDVEGGYLCYFDQKQGTVANLFQVGDIAMGQMFDTENQEERYYRAVVTAVTENSITLSSTNKAGSGVPRAGDTIVQYGNISNSNRQFVIIRDVIGGGYEQMLSGLNSVTAIGNEYYYAGAKNTSGTLAQRWFVGNSSGEYAKWENGQLSIKGRVSVLGSDSSYHDMATVLDGMPDKDELAQYLGYDDYADLEDAALNSQTIISGGYLRTSLIKTSELIADSAFVNDLVVSKLRTTDATDNHGIIINDKTFVAQDSDEVARVEIIGDSIGVPQGSSSISSLGIQSKSSFQYCSPGTTTINLSSSSVSITASGETIVTVPPFSINVSVRNDSPGIISTNLDRCQVAPYVRVYYGSRLVKQVYPGIAMDMRGKGRGESATATINVPYFTFVTATDGEFSYEVLYELQTTETGGRNYTFAFSTASALSLDIAPIYLHTKLGSDGIRAQFSGNSYFEAKMSDDSSSAVTIRVGKYGIKVDGSGVYKYDYSNNSWVAVPSLM